MNKGCTEHFWRMPVFRWAGCSLKQKVPCLTLAQKSMAAAPLGRPVTVAIVGAGSRGKVCAGMGRSSMCACDDARYLHLLLGWGLPGGSCAGPAGHCRLYGFTDFSEAVGLTQGPHAPITVTTARPDGLHVAFSLDVVLGIWVPACPSRASAFEGTASATLLTSGVISFAALTPLPLRRRTPSMPWSTPSR